MNAKQIFIFAGVAVILLAYCNATGVAQKIESVLLSENVEYDVPVINLSMIKQASSPMEIAPYWDRENIESSSRCAFAQLLFNTAFAGKLKITDPDGKIVDSAHVRTLLIKTDTVRLTRPVPPYDEYDTVISASPDPNQIIALRFREKWTYNPETMKISKKVIAYAPVIDEPDPANGETKAVAVFWVQCSSATTGKAEILTHRITYTLSHKGDHHNYYLKHDSVKEKEYLDRLFKLVYAGKFSAYTYSGGLFFDSLTTGTNIQKTMMEYHGPFVLRFMEEWSFDINTFAFTKKQVGFCPVLEVYDFPTGELKGFQPMFWVYYADIWQPFNQKVVLKK